jgi:hypothetical protein
MATNEELEKRICALEAQAREDNSMVFKKAPNIVNRLLVAYERIEALEEGFQRERENTMCDMDKLFEQLSDAHNVLCDALIQYGAVVDDADGDAYDIAINDARIPQNDDDEDDLMDNDNRDFLLSATGEELEAQDEPRNCTDEDDEQSQGNDTLQGDNVSPETDTVSVDALMGGMREALRDKILEFHSDYADHEEWQADDCPKNIHEYGNATEVEAFSTDVTNAIEKIVSPIIERLVRERDQAVKEIVRLVAIVNKQNADLAQAHARELRAEAELEDVKLGRERVIAERDAMQGCMPWLRKMCNEKNIGELSHLQACGKQALAKLEEAQKGGDE